MKSLHTFALPLLFLSLLLAGCVNPPVPDECKAYSGKDFDTCIFRAAIVSDNPLYCYSVNDKASREKCMKDATGPAADLPVIGAEKDETADAPSPEENVPEYEPAYEERELAPVPAQCKGKEPAQIDGCILEFAIKSWDILACEAISDNSVMDSCITQVASRTKDISACQSLSTENARNLCRAYAIGG